MKKKIYLDSWKMEEMKQKCGDCETPNNCKELKCEFYFGDNVEIWEK